MVAEALLVQLQDENASLAHLDTCLEDGGLARFQMSVINWSVALKRCIGYFEMSFLRKCSRPEVIIMRVELMEYGNKAR